MGAYTLEDDGDFVVVGTGAGGATAARVLSAAGREVVLLDEGPRLPTAERPRALLGAMVTAFRDFGTTTTRGTSPFPLLQGRLVGGSTAINSGICWRMPEDVRRDWVERYGLAELAEERALGRAFDAIERELEIGETSDQVLGNNAALMALACERLKLPGKVISRNAARCKGTAQCLQGCPGEARQSMDVSYIPRALASGARLHAQARVDRVLSEGGRAVGVEGELVERGPGGRSRGRFRVRARRGVIVAASAVQTPVLLRRSGLRGLVGERFQAHPGAAVVGRFKDPVAMGQGATQGYEVPLRDRFMKLESLSMPPEMLGARLPGAGPAWQERLGQLDHFAQWCVLVRMEAHGTVRPTLFGTGSDAAVSFTPTALDVSRLREGLATLCRMMFAAGALEVYPGIAGLPPVLKDAAEVALVEGYDLKARHLNLMASHLFGSACAGRDPARSVVGQDLQAHALPGLYVMDSSVFPTNLGVNPQHSIMGVVWRAAERLAA